MNMCNQWKEFSFLLQGGILYKPIDVQGNGNCNFSAMELSPFINILAGTLRSKYVKFSLGEGRELGENTWTLLLKSQYDFHSTYESNMESMSKDGVFLSNHAHVMISFMLGLNVISFTNSSKSIE